MIKTTIIALIEGRRYEFTSELAEVAGWADTAEETTIGLLHDGMDQLARAIEREPWPTQVTDENGNRQCYLCGFFHDEPGSCANGTPTNITPGPDDEQEYDGPTDNDSDRFLSAGDEDYDPDEELDDDRYHGPEAGDYVDRVIAQADIVRERIGRSVVEASKRESVQCQEGKHWHCHMLTPDCACACHIGEAARGRSIKRDEADQ